MSDENWNETILELKDRIMVVENVPARISLETGERCFAPETKNAWVKWPGNQKKPHA